MKQRTITKSELNELAQQAGFRMQYECGGCRVVKSIDGGYSDIYPNGGICATVKKAEAAAWLTGYLSGSKAGPHNGNGIVLLDPKIKVNRMSNKTVNLIIHPYQEILEIYGMDFCPTIFLAKNNDNQKLYMVYALYLTQYDGKCLAWEITQETLGLMKKGELNIKDSFLNRMDTMFWVVRIGRDKETTTEARSIPQESEIPEDRFIFPELKQGTFPDYPLEQTFEFYDVPLIFTAYVEGYRNFFSNCFDSSDEVGFLFTRISQERFEQLNLETIGYNDVFLKPEFGKVTHLSIFTNKPTELKELKEIPEDLLPYEIERKQNDESDAK